MTKNDLEILKSRLPEFPDIHCKEKYFNAAVLVPIIEIENEFHILFEKRTENIRQGTEVCFPGGKFDPDYDKNYEDAAVRETVEELGINRKNIDILGRLDTLITPLGITVDPFAARLNIKDLDELKINKKEVEKIFTLPFNYLKTIKCDEYKIRVEMQPSYIDKNGEKKILLPSKEMGLPKKYHKPWGITNHRILVYKTYEGIIWGITGEIIYGLKKYF